MYIKKHKIKYVNIYVYVTMSCQLQGCQLQYLVRIEIEIWYKIINNFQHSMFCLNVYIQLFL